ncbi:MAG: DnaJ domain-containing protein, partial [Gammaproteobacteria bacterium]|nr:DnaJ domain-containing protein [Gammaproteobacteria bacterium]
VNLRATENSTINKVMPGISTVTAKTSSVAANETVTAAATRMPVAPKTTSVGQVQNTPPPAKLSPSETVTRVAPSTPASTAVPPARATPMPPVSAEAPTNNIARSAPQSAAPPRVEPKKPVPPETIAASVPSNEGQGVKVNRTGVQTPVQKSATAESPVPSTTVNPVVPATLAVPAAARKAAPVAPAALATATAGDEEDDIPVLTVENHALAKGVTTRRLDAEATPSPVTPNAKKAPEPVVKTTEKSLPEVKVAPPVVTPPTAKTSVENEKVVAASGSKPKTSADEFEKAAQDGANKPAPSVKTPPRSPVGGNSGNGSGSVGRSGSLAPAASRPAAQTTRLPSPLQRLILVAEQIQANPSPSEALELVASALLEPLPELLQFAFSKEPLNEEWSAVLTNRAPGEVRELARQFIKTVIMAPSSDLYQVLCLTRDATDEQVQNNYRALFKLLQSGPGKEVHPAAAARLNHAYQVLRDPARRLAYEISPNAVTAEAASEPSPLVSTAQEAPTISAVEAVSVPSPQTAAVEPVDAEEVEDEEVAEAHWWLPRPAILIGVGVVIASVFGVVIWQLSQSPAANSTAAADAANSAESSAPRAFSAAVGSVPNSAETKPAATTKETTSLGGGVPAPVTHADLQILVKKLTSTYERGNIDNFVALFDSNVKTNDGTGVAGVRDDYQKLFKDTRRRNMDITNLRWQFSGPTAKGDGDFRVVILSGDGSEHEVKGKLKLQVAKMGEQAYITGMDYKYGPGAQ